MGFAISGFADDGALSGETEAPAAPANRLCTVGDYELLSEIARGGMGVVYRARQKSLNRLAAVKLILVGQWASPAQVQRFKGEAAAAAKLDHPNIVPIYEIGEANGQHFFSMKLVDGGNLAQSISGSGIDTTDFRRAARLLATVARAVHYAHQRGILHRDLKPTNILVDTHGEPHLTDFGLAKAFEQDSGTTVSAALLGTPAYMAPEQAAGKGAQITTAADLYSLGAILYQLLTGKPPFTGDSAMEVLQAARDREPELPRRRNPAVPRDLELICLKCLNKEASRRYGSAEALAEDLDRWLGGEPIQARPVSPAERLVLWAKRKPVIAGLSAAVIVLVSLTAVISTLMAWRIAAARDRATALAETNRRQLVELNLANGLRLLSAGNDFESLPWLVEALRLDADNLIQQKNHRIRLASIVRELPGLHQVWFHDGPVTDAAWSPDESRLATASDNKIYLWDSRTGTPLLPALETASSSGPVQQPISGTTWFTVSFSPNGRRLLAVGENSTRVWDPSTGMPVGPPLIQGQPVHDAVFSPDGQEVWTAGEDQMVRRWSVDRGQWIGEPIAVGAPAQRLAWNPNGRSFAVASTREATRLWDRATLKPIGEPLTHTSRVLDVAFSPDGSQIATAGADSRARLWDAKSGHPTGRLFWHTDGVTQLAFSHDGKRLVTVSFDHTAKVWLLTDESREPLVLNHGAAVNRAVFSPDGSQVATASADHSARVWDAEDGRPLTPPLPHNGEVSTVQFSADGRRLLTASSDGTARLWMLPVTTTTQMLFRDSWWFKRPPAVSRNGRFALLMNPENMALIWDIAAEQIVGPAIYHPSPAHLGAVTDDGRLAITVCYDGQVRLWDFGSGNLQSNSIPFDARHLPPLLSPDRLHIVLADGNGAMAICDVQKRAEPIRIPAPELPPQCGAYATDGKRFVIGARDFSARVFDATSGKEIARLKQDAPVTAVCFNRDGSKVASGDESGQVFVWPVADPKSVVRMSHPRRLNTIAFSPESKRLLTGCDDGAARLWDIASGTLLLPPMQHSSPLHSVVFSTDGRRAVTVDRQLNGQLWELDTGHPLTPARRYHTRKEPDAETALAGTDADWNWNLRSDDRSLDELVREASALSGRKLDRVGGLTPLGREELKAVWEEQRLNRR